MDQSVSNDLINLGINFGFALFFFGILCGVASCIIKCYNNDVDENHDHGNINDHVMITIMECSGINPSVLRSTPVVDFDSRDFKNSVECVVCLTELADGDKARVLPSCNHWFHADCIDLWFRSHSTCPICRKKVSSVQQRTTPELDESLTQNHVPRSEDTTVVEDVGCGEANESRPDLTAVVINIPTKLTESLSARFTE